MTQLFDQIPDFSACHNPRGATHALFYLRSVKHAHDVANEAFAPATSRFIVEEDDLDAIYEERLGTEPTLLEGPMLGADRVEIERTVPQEAGLEIDRVESPALAAVEDLRRWLGSSYDEVAEIAGLGGASTIFYWKTRYRRGHDVRPRLSTVERLYRVHAVLRALAEALEGKDGVQAVQLWLRQSEAGEATPLELLKLGQIEAVYDRARPLLFDTSPRRPPVARTLATEDQVEAETEAPRRSRRRLTATDFG